MSDEEYVTLQERCSGCAFREGTEASRCERTQLKARLCLETADPFYCHQDPSRRALCRGWADAAQARLDKGIQPATGYRREILDEANAAIIEYEENHLADSYDEAARLYEIACSQLDAEGTSA